MEGEQMDVRKYLCEKTKELWHYYILEPTEENFGKIIQTWSTEKFSMIGTGKHEIFGSFQQAVEDMEANQKEAIRFDLLDEWYEASIIDENTAVVYGGFWVREHREAEKDALIEMDTRFSLIYARDETGEWKIVHIHHSMPYFDQAENEYYPKALSVKVREALSLVELFRKRSEMDLMTGVYNHASFQKQVEQKLDRGEEFTFYIIDLDNFKSVNDTCGHSTGDSLLIYLARLLQKYFSQNASVGRLGGDEFAVWESDSGNCPGWEEKLRQMQEEFRRGTQEILDGNAVSYSVGIAHRKKESGALTYRQLYKRADEALYRAKHSGKDTLSVSGQ